MTLNEIMHLSTKWTKIDGYDLHAFNMGSQV